MVKINQMKNWQERTKLLFGKNDVLRLNLSHILIVGVGGVGGYAAEQLCRAGIGSMTIVDSDTVDISNINRQLISLSGNVGVSKVDILEERLKNINPDINITKIEKYVHEEEIDELLEKEYDYVVDAIDTLTPKVHLIETCLNKKQKIISSMGAGGKYDPSQIEIADISKSYNCGLARMIRKRLYKRGIRKGVKVVFSPEDINESAMVRVESRNKKSNVGTVSYMPAIFGCMCASVVIRGLLDR